MRKALLERFILVLLAALCINSVIFYIASSKMMLKNSKNDMTYTIRAVDSILDYDRDLMEQMKRLEAFTDRDSSRVTLINSDGTVVTDSDADAEYLDNHLGREEVRAAVEHGEGYARRYSKTLGKTMLYVACRSEYSDMVLRLAVPYSGIQEYLPMLFPAAILSFLMAMVCSVVTTRRFVSSVTRPLRDISKAVMKVKGDYTELQFESCQYPEINVIAETIMNMSKDVKEYLSQIEKEKQIRQEFFSNASHELKTPITSIQGYAELLESGMIQDDGMKLDFARRIKKEAAGMTGLINDILMISRLESMDAEVMFSDVRISVLLQEIMDSLKPLAASCQVFLHVDVKPLCIRANLQQMKELFTNLATNAIKYNRPGGQVWITVGEQGDDMLVRVKDNGVGIPKESLDRIFERFYLDKAHAGKTAVGGVLAVIAHEEKRTLRHGERKGHVARHPGELGGIRLVQGLAVHIDQAFVGVQVHQVAALCDDPLYQGLSIVDIAVQHHHVAPLRGVKGALNQQPVAVLQGVFHRVAAHHHNARRKGEHQHQNSQREHQGVVPIQKIQVALKTLFFHCARPSPPAARPLGPCGTKLPKTGFFYFTI